MSRIILNILVLSLRAWSVRDFFPLQEHLSELVGNSSLKSPEGKVLGIERECRGDKDEVSLKILQV